MNQEIWDSMTPAQKDAARDLSGLTPQLVGLEGWRVEVVSDYDETRRFYVSRSTGWVPCHIEVHNRRSMGGIAAAQHYKSVRKLYRR